MRTLPAKKRHTGQQDEPKILEFAHQMHIPVTYEYLL